MVKSEIFHVKLLQEAISRSASELPMRLTKSTQLTNQLAELILNDVVNEVVQETESSLGNFNSLQIFYFCKLLFVKDHMLTGCMTPS